METLHVATITHRHGVNTYVARSLKQVMFEVDEYVQEWWGEEIDSEEMPGSAQERTDRYFGLAGEGLDIDETVLLDHVKDPWEPDPDYPVEDWQHEVAANDTRLGYLDWVEHQREGG